MSIIEWFPLLSESAKAVVAQNESNSLFVAYAVLCVIIKRPAFLLAFFMSCLLFEVKVFDHLEEYQLYMITFIIYSYVFYLCETNRSKFGCAVIILLAIILAHDARGYGVNGVYGEYQTVVHNNIEYLALGAHAIFICSLIPHRRILNYLRRIAAFIVRLSRNSVVMQFI